MRIINKLSMDNMQTDETKVALIGKDISYINQSISEIKQSIQNFGVTFVTTAQYQDDKRLWAERIERLEKASNLWRWLSPTLAALLGSVLTFLVISFLSNPK